MIGTVLSNRYKLIAELGSGGMAWVYLAEDLIQGGKVAVKILYPQHSRDLLFVERFRREAQLSMALSQSSPQPNVVCILDYGADRDTHYLVMEYVPGQDLGQLLEQQGPLPWQNALRLTQQVALALSHAHHLDIVHRDIKPSNIMVLPDGTARVLDFGIARVRTSRHLTLSGFVGSPHYAAPEQARGEHVDIRADIYSLGIVLYRMLSGDLPYQGDTPWAVVNQHVTASPPPLDGLCPDLPEPVVQLVQKAMAKSPEDRFQTPDEMAQAIDTLLLGSGPAPGPLPVTAPTKTADLDEIRRRAQQAAQGERWQEAIDLLSQILRIDPEYPGIADQLHTAGQQLRLVTLYRLAERSLETGQWDQALNQLDVIASIDPQYRDIDSMRLRAERREATTATGAHPDSEFPTQVPRAAERQDAPGEDAPPEPESPAARPVPPVGRPSRSWFLLAGGLIGVLLIAVAAYAIFSATGQPAPTPAADAGPSATNTTRPTLAPSGTATPTARPSATLSPSVLTTTAERAIASPTTTQTASPTPSRPVPSATPSLTPTPTETATPTPTASAYVPAAPPLSGQIAFPRFDPDRSTFDIYACTVAGEECNRVYAQASQPDFLPGGNRLVVHSWKPDDKGLILISRAGERIWRITDQIEAARPAVDLGGEFYVYHSRAESDRQPRLFRTYGVDTVPILRAATPVLGLSPSWLPDGRILYSGCWQDDCGIIVTRADGTDPRQVVAGTSEADPEASPNGRQLVFMSLRDGNWEVYSARIDGGDPRRLTKNSANDGLPTWSPDGRTIAFVTDRDGEWAVWIMRPDGTGQRRLFDIGGPLDGPVRDAALHESHGWVEERISWALLP